MEVSYQLIISNVQRIILRHKEIIALCKRYTAQNLSSILCLRFILVERLSLSVHLWWWGGNHIGLHYSTCFFFSFILQHFLASSLFITSAVCSSSFGKKIHPNRIPFGPGCKLWFQGREICTLASLCHWLSRVTILLHRHPSFTYFERSSFERWGIGEDSISTRSIWMYRIT